LKLEETKEILRHANIQTTSDIYKGLPLEAKRAAQQRLVEFVRAEAKKSLTLQCPLNCPWRPVAGHFSDLVSDWKEVSWLVAGGGFEPPTLGS